MRAVVKPGKGEMLIFKPVLQILLHSTDVPFLATSLGDAALIGHDDQRVAGLLQHTQRAEHVRIESHARRVGIGGLIFHERPVLIQKDGASHGGLVFPVTLMSCRRRVAGASFALRGQSSTEATDWRSPRRRSSVAAIRS